jgi:hypothetical protein
MTDVYPMLLGVGAGGGGGGLVRAEEEAVW